MTQSYALCPHLDSSAAATLAGDLLTHRGTPLTVAGGDVKFAGALGLQVLISARLQWKEDGVEFHVSPVSEPLAAACRALGISNEDIGADANTILEGETTE